MARRVTVAVVDDIDPTIPADETLNFTFDGTDYVIDLSSENAKKFRDNVAPWISAATRIGRSTTAASPNLRTPEQRKEAAEARKWALDKGLTTSKRGRLSEEVMRAYRERDK